MIEQTAEHIVSEIRWILGIDGDADVIAHVRRVFDLTIDQEETIGVLQGGHDVALAEVERLHAALAQIAAMPIDAHTCKDHVMREVAATALSGRHGATKRTRDA